MIFNTLHPRKQNKATNKHTTQSQKYKSTNSNPLCIGIYIAHTLSDSPPQLAGFAV